MFNSWISGIVKRTIKEITLDTENKFEAMHSKFRTIESLEQEISRLKIDKSVREEEFARKEREITHKLGLERIRQEQDALVNKRNIELDIREKNISVEEKRFVEQIEFQRKHLEGQITSLNSLVEKVFEQIPKVSYETKTIKRITEGSEYGPQHKTSSSS